MTTELKYVNLWQTNEERRDKYLLLRTIGLTRNQAYRMRDWHITKIERLYHFTKTNQRLPIAQRVALLTQQYKLRLQFNTAS